MSSPQTIFRVKKSSNFAVISRITLEDSRLSWEARGMYAFLLAKPDDWEICMAHLINSSPAGRDKTRKAIKELMEFNYIVKTERRDQRGQFSSPLYLVYESPLDGYFDSEILPGTENPSPVNPLPVKPSPDDHPLLNIHTNQRVKLTNNTTTTNSNFVWPENLRARDRDSILSLSLNIETVVVQLLLDELSGQLENIKNPVGYFRTLLLSYNAGTFVPARALHVQFSRKTRKHTERAIHEAIKRGEARLESLVEKHQGKKHL